ncbi:MAG: hypothetical protein RL160_1342 [Bacteroidota bacterium]
MMALVLLAYIPGLWVDVMDVDASQYASISREMADSGSFLEVMHRGENYLDKPPLLFWLSALLFKIFGPGNLVYKLPSFLVTILGLYSLFRLTERWYDRNTGLLAAIILGSSLAWYQFNNDVRTDTLLAGFVVFAVWQLDRFSNSGKVLQFIAGFSGIALAMMSKGPIGLIAPAMALGGHWLLRREWKQIFRPVWILGLLLIGILLLPMFVGLYRQYGWEGPYFFLWTQSFGRITGENVWSNDAGYFYFTHIFLWSFAPWSLAVIGALYVNISTWMRSRFQSMSTQAEFISLFGWLLPFAALSLSQYKLPHYVFVCYPFAAMFLAGFLKEQLEQKTNSARWFLRSFQLFPPVMLLLALAIPVFIFPPQDLRLWALLLCVVIFWASMALFWKKHPGTGLQKWILACVLAAAALNFQMNSYFYPNLLRYEAPAVAARDIRELNIPISQFRHAPQASNIHAFEFYSEHISPYWHGNDIRICKPYYTLCKKNTLDSLKAEQCDYTIFKTYADYRPTTLRLNFLNRATRGNAVDTLYLIHFGTR